MKLKTFSLTSIIIAAFLSISCRTNKVIITKEYVINPNWTPTDNSFEVQKMKPKDSTIIINLVNPSETDLYYGLIADTTPSYVCNVKYNNIPYSNRKVYFNKDNGFNWFEFKNARLGMSLKILGDLQPTTWYLLAGLSQFGGMYYVFLDTSDSLHVYKVSTMTNY